jgi:hypothetical protein
VLSLLLRYRDEFVSFEGGLWLLAIDALLLIPLVFAAFFYPREALLTAGVLLIVTFAAYEVFAYRRRRLQRRTRV